MKSQRQKSMRNSSGQVRSNYDTIPEICAGEIYKIENVPRFCFTVSGQESPHHSGLG